MALHHFDAPGGGAGMGSVLEFDDPALLRAARVVDVLRGCGRLLAASAGSAGTYELSSPVDWIDVFISHNWAHGRRRKFMALAMHFNLDMACYVAVSALVLAACLFSVVARSHEDLAQVFPVVSSATVLAFFAAFFFGHEVQAALGFRGKRAFLDKVCIHQTDMGLKERGIRSLGAFLHKSDSMVVCFTGLYLKRLWTVYEFATFLLVRGESSPGAIHVMPANLPVLILASSFCFLCATAVWRALFLVPNPAIFNALSFLVLQGTLVAGGRWWARRQEEARAHFEHFALDRASCDSELDRALVGRNIVALMRHFSQVGPHVFDADVLQAFDQLVRTAGSHAFSASVGGLGVSYKLILPFLLTTVSNTIQNFTFSCVYPGHGFETAWQTALQLLAVLGSSFLMIPLAMALAMQLMKRCLALRGALEVVYCVGVGLFETTAMLTLDPQIGALRPWLLDAALERSAPLPFLLYTAALFAATAVVYRPPQRKVGAALIPTEHAATFTSLPGVTKSEASTSTEHGSEVDNTEANTNAEYDCEAQASFVALDVSEVHSHGQLQEARVDPAALCVFGSVIGSGTVVQLTRA